MIVFMKKALATTDFVMFPNRQYKVPDSIGKALIADRDTAIDITDDVNPNRKVYTLASAPDPQGAVDGQGLKYAKVEPVQSQQQAEGKAQDAQDEAIAKRNATSTLVKPKLTKATESKE